MSRSRILIYVFYDRDGIVDDYVVQQLEQMRTQVDRIVMVCQGGVREDNLAKAKDLTDELYCRENKGYDASAWKEALTNYVGWSEIAKYDDLILMNDSCYGPIYPIEEMFNKMDSRELDFWGVTRHGEAHNAYKLNPYGYIPAHIQSYFTCYRKNIHTSEVFKNYWEQLPEINTFEESVSYFETVITKILEDEGYKWDVYTDGSLEERPGRKCYNPTIFLADMMLSEQRNPFIKKKTMSGLLDMQFCRSDGNVARRCLDYIDRETEYDVNMIYKTILRLGNVRELYELYHWDYILPDTVSYKKQDDKKIALIMHLYYEDLIEECLSYANSMPEYADVFITVADSEKKKKIDEYVSGFKNNKVEVRLISNRGMDIASLLVGCRDVLTCGAYDYVCFTHDKRSFYDTNPGAGIGFRRNMLKCMLESKEYIENIVTTFEENPRLGLLVPPYPIVGKYIKMFGQSWCGNEDAVKELARKLEIKCNISDKFDTIGVGTSFWCRPAALKELMDYPWTHEDFEENPEKRDGDLLHAVERIFEFVAQSNGFYTGVVMPISHAQLVYSLEDHLLRKNLAKNRELKEANKKLNKIANSRSTKLGYALTAVPRKLKGKSRD